jgi:hypothetical protein
MFLIWFLMNCVLTVGQLELAVPRAYSDSVPWDEKEPQGSIEFHVGFSASVDEEPASGGLVPNGGFMIRGKGTIP